MKWKGYKELSWEPAENLDNCRDKIRKFKARRKVNDDSASNAKTKSTLEKRKNGDQLDARRKTQAIQLVSSEKTRKSS